MIVLVHFMQKQPSYSVRFSPTRTIAAADTYVELERKIAELPESRMRQLFETASARRRRCIYAEAMKRGVDLSLIHI